MTIYIIGIIVFSLVLISSIFVLIYFIKDEKKPQEVSNSDLLKMGKVYTKEDLEERLFNQYTAILEGTQYANYSFLKDAVSDQLYNNMLLQVKQQQEQHQEKVIANIKLDFSKLIGMYTENDLEIAKLWVRYSNIEYIKGFRKELDENKNEVIAETIISGDQDKPINNEKILTFVKTKAATESVVCPSCGYQTHILTSSKCIRCDWEIVPKKLHWVFVDSVDTNISKN